MTKNTGGRRQTDPLPEITARFETAGWSPHSDDHPGLFIKEEAGRELRFRLASRCTVAVVENGIKLLLITWEEGPGADPVGCVDEIIARAAALFEVEWEALAVALTPKAPSIMVFGEWTGEITYKPRTESGKTVFVPSGGLPGLRPTSGALRPFAGPARGFLESSDRTEVSALRQERSLDCCLPWGKSELDRFPALLSTDRERNLKERHAYYRRKKLISRHHAFADHIATKQRHAVWYPEDGEDVFSYSIGLYYLYNLPELLVINESDDDLDAATLGRFVDSLATAQVAGRVRVEPATTVHDTLMLPETEELVGSFCMHLARRFVLADDEDRERYLGFGSWFYMNYMDLRPSSYPALVLRLR